MLSDRYRGIDSMHPIYCLHHPAPRRPCVQFRSRTKMGVTATLVVDARTERRPPRAARLTSRKSEAERPLVAYVVYSAISVTDWQTDERTDTRAHGSR